MNDLREDILAYTGLQEDLESQHFGKWVIVHDRQLVAVKDSFQEAAELAVERFGRGPYLIRQVGARAVTLPASVMYKPAYA